MSVPKFQNLWWWDFRASIDPVSLNHAYAHDIVYPKGSKGKNRRPIARRFLTDEGKLYKKKWKHIFRTQAPGMPNFRQDDIPEKERLPLPKVYLDFQWLFVLKDSDFEYGTGRIKGKDLSNLFKLVEDSLCEFIGIDDSQTLHIVGDKRRSKLFETQAIVSVKMRLGSPDIEQDPELMKRYGRLLIPRMESLMTEAVVSSSQAGVIQIEDVLEEYCLTDEAKNTIRMTLQEFGTDAKMLLTVCGDLYTKNLVKEGFWWALIQRVNAEFAEQVRKDMEKKKPKAKKEPKASKVKELSTLTAQKRGAIRTSDPKKGYKRDVFHAMLLGTQMTMEQIANACKGQGSKLAWSDATKLLKEYQSGKYGPESDFAKKAGWYAEMKSERKDGQDEAVFWIAEGECGQ